MEQRCSLTINAKAYLQQKLYGQVLANIQKIIPISELLEEEREILTLASRMWINNYRLQWRKIESYLKDETNTEVEEIKMYRNLVRMKIETISKLVLNILKTAKFSEQISIDSQVSVLRLKADCYRYQTEVAEDEEIKYAAHKTLNAYMKVCLHLTGALHQKDPLRAEIPLYFATLYQESKVAPITACYDAQKFFEKLRMMVFKVPLKIISYQKGSSMISIQYARSSTDTSRESAPKEELTLLYKNVFQYNSSDEEDDADELNSNLDIPLDTTCCELSKKYMHAILDEPTYTCDEDILSSDEETVSISKKLIEE
ncbi:14-3-3-like protein RA215 [Teleopsis dalmanni]|uniref:14-3-3-like protein RA215 n=1 Tax=Teleopsis dalmanni TaxID=139649 RepID=UPI0018CEACED|nr:14-3-3-like protein RA215 [Teleopsis dalmanni]